MLRSYMAPHPLHQLLLGAASGTDRLPVDKYKTNLFLRLPRRRGFFQVLDSSGMRTFFRLGACNRSHFSPVHYDFFVGSCCVLLLEKAVEWRAMEVVDSACPPSKKKVQFYKRFWFSILVHFRHGFSNESHSCLILIRSGTSVPIFC